MPFIQITPFTPHPYETIREGVLPSIVAENIYQGWVRKYERMSHVEGFSLRYQSGDYAVTGLQLQPAELKPEGHPIILFNRGGRGKYGMLNVLTINNLLIPLVERGYIVLASQYRGVDGGEGEDEFGGAEVEDITSLATLAPEIKGWDGRNLFQFGWSRGGMMTLLALKAGLKCNAAALGAPLIDLTLSANSESSAGREAWLARVLPHYEQEGFAALEARSAPYWLPKLNATPLLLMHGEADKDVSILHSRHLAAKLKQAAHPHKLIEYPEGNHYLNRERMQVMDEVADWFAGYEVL